MTRLGLVLREDIPLSGRNRLTLDTLAETLALLPPLTREEAADVALVRAEIGKRAALEGRR